jgi:ABC-type transport system substrate-binding protein
MPDRGSQGCNDSFCGLFMEHLFNLSPQNQLEPELATSVTQPSPLTYVYHLRHGVRFWDGHPMTSADVVYSLDYQREPSAFTAVYFDDVKSIEPAGPFTVVIKLKQPNAGWKYSLSYEGVIFEKRSALAHQGTLGNPGTLIEATGPWEIKTYDPTSAGDIDLAFPSNGKAFAANSGAKVDELAVAHDLVLLHGPARGPVARRARAPRGGLRAQPDRYRRGRRRPADGRARGHRDPGQAAALAGHPGPGQQDARPGSTARPTTPTPGGDMFAGLGAVSPDPSILPSYALGSQATYNVAHYAPPVISTLLARGLSVSNPARRLAIYGQVLRQVGADEPYVVLYGGLSFTALSSKFTLPRFYEYPSFFSWALRLWQAG